MDEPHRIRLLGPWEYRVLERFGEPLCCETVGRVKPPCDWSASLGPAFRGVVEYTRRFGEPGFTEAHERLHLALDGVRGHASVALNGELLGSIDDGAPARYEVTGQLLFRNVLTITITQPLAATEPGGLTGEIRLEID